MALHLLFSLAIVVVQAQTPGAPQAPMPPSDRLRLLDAEVVADLLVRDLDVVLEDAQRRPGGVDEAIKRLILCLRAGRRTEAASVVDYLGTLGIDERRRHALLEFLSDRREFDLVTRFAERVPSGGRDESSDIANHSVDDTGKPPQEFDQWLADRGLTTDRFALEVRQKTDGPIVARVVAKARSLPCTPEALARVLSFTSEASSPVKVDWILDWCPTPTARDAYDLGQHAMFSKSSIAAIFLERALAMPFTSDDVEREKWPRAIIPNWPDAEYERQFRARVRLELAEIHRLAGDESRAQAVLRQLIAEDRSMITDVEFASEAGYAESDSDVRHLEQELRAAESTHGNTRDYWIARARYFEARGEDADTRQAFERALAVARTEAPERRATQRVLREYDEYLTQRTRGRRRFACCAASSNPAPRAKTTGSSMLSATTSITRTSWLRMSTGSGQPWSGVPTGSLQPACCWNSSVRRRPSSGPLS